MRWSEEQIGDCRLILGDALEVLPGLAADSIDMIWTDPPYGHGNHDGDWNARLNKHRGIEGRPIANDDEAGMRRVVDAVLAEAARLLKPDCCCCCCCGGGGPRPTFAWLAERMDREGLAFFHSVIWDKHNPGLGWRYRRQHEMVMVAHRAGGRLLWADDNITARNVFGMMPPRERIHPNQKPLGLVENFVRLHSTPGQIVLDPFMGAGTTGVACAKLGRAFIGVEIDEGYYEAALRRIEDAYKQGDLFVEAPQKAEQLALDDYDPTADALGSYHDAISEIRRRGLLSGEYEPVNDEERRMVEEGRGK